MLAAGNILKSEDIFEDICVMEEGMTVRMRLRQQIHFNCPGDDRPPTVDGEFFGEVFDVAAHGQGGDDQCFGDFAVRFIGSQEGQHFTLASCQADLWTWWARRWRWDGCVRHWSLQRLQHPVQKGRWGACCAKACKTGASCGPASAIESDEAVRFAKRHGCLQALRWLRRAGLAVHTGAP